MLLFLRMLILLWLINFAPPLLAHFLHDKWNTPLDFGRSLRDGNPLFGPHKTVRGILAATATGLLVGLLLGFPWWVGLLAGVLSMVGDLVSSFIKRRQGMPSGNIVPGLDQVFEGVLPFAVLGPYFELSVWEILLLLALFSFGAFVGSCFFKNILLDKPFEKYPRPVRSSIRLRELRSCQITSNPLHHLLNFEDSFYYHFVMKTAFRALGIYETGKQNALQIQKREVCFAFQDLPVSFQDYTILFFSDLHLDGLDGLTEKLQVILREQPADLCILGGDFRMETHGPFREALARLSQVLPEIRTRDGIIGILGNHDCVEIVEPLTEKGVSFLINDSRAIQRNGERIWIVGVDDPHYYKCHDLNQAFEEVPREDFSILVAHSNEIYKEASGYGPRLYLCGHTHAGQIQLPYVGPVFTHSSAPRRLCQGEWRHENMLGYTSCGVGVSGVPVRFASQGEVLLIRLKRAEG